MTGSAPAALVLAIAVLVGPGHTMATRRLAALRLQPAALASRTPWSLRRIPAAQLLPVVAGLAVLVLIAARDRGLPGLLFGVPVGFGVLMGSRFVLRRVPAKARAQAADSFRLASGWDMLAACLRGGLSVPAAVRAIAVELPDDAARPLLRTAELLALGSDPEAAWEPALCQPLTAELARGARRTARSGAALAGVAESLAANVRAQAVDAAEARAQRAGVAVTGPLGLCFLPAFLCIGVVPVVIGLASRLLASW